MKNIFFAACVIALAGCASTSAVKLTGNTYPPVSPDQVRVFTSEDDITIPFEKVAIITSEGDTGIYHKTSLIEKMKKKAAQLGANGLILGQFKEATTGQKVAQAFLGTSAANKIEATAIRFKTKKRPARPAMEEEEGY